MRSISFALLLLAAAPLAGCRSGGAEGKADPARMRSAPAERPVRRVVGTDPGAVGAGTKLQARPGNELAAFAAGCFWGVEDNFRQVPGVVATAVGYTGGHTSNPTYESVCSHTTGPADTVWIESDPTAASYEDPPRIFSMTHDPTTKNGRGRDSGDQSRSAVFTLWEAQATTARAAVTTEEARLHKHVVTEVTPLG